MRQTWVESTNQYDNSTGYYEIKILSSGYLNFEYLLSSETNYDFFKLYVNNSQKMSDSGQYENYKSYKIYVYSGDVIRFYYTKDSSESRGDDKVIIKNIVLSYQ